MSNLIQELEKEFKRQGILMSRADDPMVICLDGYANLKDLAQVVLTRQQEDEALITELLYVVKKTREYTVGLRSDQKHEVIKRFDALISKANARLTALGEE